MEQMDLVVRGKLVLEDEVISGEVGVKDGKVAVVNDTYGSLTGEKTLDFGNAYVFPGMIDTHVHCYSNPDEGIIATSKSAAAGGITTFVDMPYDLPNPINNVDQFQKKVSTVEEEAVVDMCLWGTIAKRGGTDQIVPLAEAGAVAFKMSTFETDEYRFPRIPDSEILKAFNLLRETGLRAAFHSENDELVVDMLKGFQEQNKVYPRAHMESRPPVTETSAAIKLMEFAYWTKSKLHIVHVSHPRTIELVRMFKEQGVDVTAETCYTYLLLDVNDLEKYGPIAKNNPPLRNPEDSEGLWKYLQSGDIELVTSDHVAWGLEKKISGKDNIFKAASGMPGLEVMVPLMFDRGVSKGRLTPVQLAKVLAQHPAEVFQIPNKGKIAVGYDADFTVIDPEQTWTIDQNDFHSNSKLSPFHGQTVKGKVMQTIVRGVTVYDGEDITVQPGFGSFVPGSAYKKALVGRI
ncbi:dihydroorotase family protein [Bacillus sp. EB600]|uniref:dihydroorotase n=1 Tax=Bacillus sp. EB600 TaxID=2806345 RepID=UPI00210E2388|nr:dihydroorotase [Bacillus sp. EB600]MCQ6278488.1 dihydroorotase [Bacillus sp. EB600]